MNRIAFLILTTLSGLGVVAGLTSIDEDPIASDRPVIERPPHAGEETPPLVSSEILEQRAREPELIEEALASTTTIIPSTTTTAAPTTTLPEPATTGAPESTTSSTATTTTEPPATTPAGGFVASAENEFGSSIDSYRSSNGLPSLSRSGSLDSYARSWAEQMASNGDLTHSDFGSLLGQWGAVAENVGVGAPVGSLFDAFIDSPGHQSNIVGDFTHVGIGVYQDVDGALWTTHVFAR